MIYDIIKMSDFTFSGSGQINMNSQFGIEIYEISRFEDVKNIFEVGSWNGQGSTLCLMNGIINKEDTKLYSLEGDMNMYNQAKNFWMDKNTKNKLFLINGTLHREIADLNHLNSLFNNNIPFFNEHYVPEKNFVETANLINIDYIDKLDFIILDGGEYSTQGDYDVLIKKDPKYIALDDVSVYKCSKIRQTLLLDNSWELYKENLEHRHGWSIFKKK
jgi:hypothetical protein